MIAHPKITPTPSFVQRGEFELCSYCGSIDVKKMIELMIIPGTFYSGSDWKYGWPHKFYVAQNLRFMSAHFLDATQDEIVLWNRLAGNLLGVKFQVIEKVLSYTAVSDGFQTWGIVKGRKHEVTPKEAVNAPVVPKWFKEKDVEELIKA